MKLELQSVSFSYENKSILQNLNLTLKQGDRIALMGPSGTGKTTLLREIYKNDHKSIEFDKDIN